MRRVGVLTSGGDAPGMNACIRAVVRTTLGMGLQAIGVRRGFQGCIDAEFEDLDDRSVGGIIQRGGTILQTARCLEFETTKGQQEALRNLNRYDVDGLVVIGGEGSMKGALALQLRGFPVVGVPASIDNDVWGTDMALGVDTALNTALGAIDKIKDTASSHQRAFVIEVMGRHSGYLALMSALAGGAEVILIPEVDTPLEQVVDDIEDAYVRGKTHSIIVVAEGAKYPGAEVASYLQAREDECGFKVRTVILGHIQRGGSPSAYDRILGSRLGAAAAHQLAEASPGVMMGISDGKVKAIPLEEVAENARTVDLTYMELADSLER